MNSRFPLARISFRSQIILLGVIAVVLFGAVVVAGIFALQYTRSAVLRGDQRRLAETTNTLVREYRDKFEAAGARDQSGLDNSAFEPDLRNMSAAALETVDGIEGGFYSRSADNIIGYAFPTRPTVANQEGASSYLTDSQSTVLQVAREAVLSGRAANRALGGDHNVVLVAAAPVLDGQTVIGSAWAAMRLTSVPGTIRLRSYLIAVALGLAALACVILTLLVVRGLQSGVRKIEGGLQNLEHDLSREIPLQGDPAEIRQIADAINRLGSTLREKIESEKRIEDRLRHAERLAALGRLVAGVAHEVRNPLATIRLRVQMCQQETTSPEVRQSCAVALQEIERLNGMVNRLLTFSRPVQLQSTPVSLGGFVEQRLGNFSDLARQHKVKLVVEFNRNARPVELDQMRIAQVFDNIIQNAIDAMSATGGTLSVNIAIEGRAAEANEAFVEFSDTGEGIRADLVGRIFDPFFTTKATGTGLGLSICHEIVEAHGGEISVVSVEGCGTTVRVTLPMHAVESFERVT